MSQSPARRRGIRVSRAVWIMSGLAVLALAAAFAWRLQPKPVKDPYRLAAVERGDVTRAVSASGTLQALVTVDVGSQISGQITKVLVDFNDVVHAGQTMAIIDPQTYETRVAQSQADIQAGEAAVRLAEANLANAEADFKRKKAMVDQGIYAPTVLDTVTAALKTGRANVAAAKARVVQSRASLRSQQVDLGRTTITAPIDGVVVDRKVQPGNTVAATLQAPVLFTIAEDLSKLQVKISVDEADVGPVKEGQTVRFTVDAFPDDTFQGVVTQVRKQPTTEQNVVSYTVIAEALNPQRKLLPGMTANADIVIETHRDVLRVPAAALRWTPPAKPAPSAGGPPVMGLGGPAPAAGQTGQAALAARVAQQLDLDARQKPAWDGIAADLRQKTMAAQASGGGDQQAIRAAMKRAFDEAFARLEPLLRSDQKAKLAALRASFAQGRSTGGLRAGAVYVLKDGKPEAVPVRVGASDGSSTEITGALKPGDQVITGGGPRPKGAAGAAFGGPAGAGGGNRVRM